MRRGERVFVLEAADVAAAKTLLERLEGMPELIFHAAAEKRSITLGQVVALLLQADLICIGETHDSDLCHRLQLHIIKVLYARDERVGVGMEMFQKPFQSALDSYVRGETSEEDFFKTTEYRQRWGYNWFLYRPIVEFCKKNGIALAALNVPRELTKRISQVGVAGLKHEEKKQLGALDLDRKDHRDYWLARLRKMHGKSKVTAEQKESSYQVMAGCGEFSGPRPPPLPQG